MKGNINNFLSKTLITYTFLLVIIFILKLVGLDYFGLDLNNEIVINLTKLINKHRLINNMYHMVPLIIYQYITISMNKIQDFSELTGYNYTKIIIAR